MSSFLLDTHALLWAAHQPRRLSEPARSALLDGGNRLLVSPVSAMEIATKNRTGKLEFTTDLAQDFIRQTVDHGMEELPITLVHAQMAGGIPHPNRDPWDRLLAAQSMIERVPLITIDPFFKEIGVETFW